MARCARLSAVLFAPAIRPWSSIAQVARSFFPGARRYAIVRAMSNRGFDNSTPQFGTAEYLGSAGADHCHFCQQPIAGSYYRINGEMACRACTQKAQTELPTDSPAAYVRGVLFGVGAAIAGLILYATFEIMTGIIIGYISLAVGWMVGKAMMKGSNGRGGRHYQITAALLTYAAVSMAAIPNG